MCLALVAGCVIGVVCRLGRLLGQDTSIGTSIGAVWHERRPLGACDSRPLPHRDHFDHIIAMWRNPLPQVFENRISGRS